MDLHATNGDLRLAGVFRLVAIGWLVACGLVFAPFVLITAAASALATGRYMEIVFVIGALVLVVPLQAVLIGSIVTAGLWMYRMRRPIRIIGNSGT